MSRAYLKPPVEPDQRSRLIKEMIQGAGRQAVTKILAMSDTDFSYATYQLTARPKNIPKDMEMRLLERSIKLGSVRNSYAAASLLFVAGVDRPPLFDRLLRVAQEITPIRVMDLHQRTANCTLRSLSRGTAAILARHLRAFPEEFEKTFQDRPGSFYTNNPKPLLVLLALRGDQIGSQTLASAQQALRDEDMPLADIMSDSAHARLQRHHIIQKVNLDHLLTLSIREIRKDPGAAGLKRQTEI